MREIILNNGTKACLKLNQNTPRIALSINFSIIEPETNAGEYLLMNRLLLKGTEKYSSEELSILLDENAIELSTEMKYDYLRFRFVALNEDFQQALEILSDIIQNSTFAEFEKEKTKLKGEIMAELDSAKVKVSDLFTKTIYKDHFYGHSYTEVLEGIDRVTFDDVKIAYKKIIETSAKTLVLVGDFDYNSTEELLNKHIGCLAISSDLSSKIEATKAITNEYVELIKEDAQQAQIIQGWLIDSFNSSLCAKYAVMNNILGSSGLSSRLFVNLRDKQGLAYTVRSQYDTMLHSAIFNMYIGTTQTPHAIFLILYVKIIITSKPQ